MQALRELEPNADGLRQLEQAQLAEPRRLQLEHERARLPLAQVEPEALQPGVQLPRRDAPVAVGVKVLEALFEKASVTPLARAVSTF